MKLPLGRARQILAVVGVTALTVGAAACGGSSSKSTSDSSASKALGSPITVMATAPVNSPASSLPQWIDAAKIYAQAVNAKGGWAGHRVTIVGCDNQVIPTVMLNCARQAASVHAVAMTGFAIPSAAVLQTLQSANIPWVNGDAVTSLELQSPISFPIDVSAVYQSSAEVALAAKDKCSSTTVLASSLDEATGPLEVQQLEAQGYRAKLDIVPDTATDLSPYLAQASGSSCLLLYSIGPNQLASMSTSLPQMNHKFQHIIVTPTLTNAIVAAAPTVWAGAQIGSVDTNIQAPEWAPYRQAISRYATVSDKKFPFSEAQPIWSSMTLIGNVVTYLLAHGHSDVTSENVLTALRSNHTWSLDNTLPPVNFSKAIGIPQAPRVVSPNASFWVVSNGALTGAYGGKYYSILPIILKKKATSGFLS
jgi:Periplasmic binding protein